MLGHISPRLVAASRDLGCPVPCGLTDVKVPKPVEVGQLCYRRLVHGKARVVDAVAHLKVAPAQHIQPRTVSVKEAAEGGGVLGAADHVEERLVFEREDRHVQRPGQPRIDRQQHVAAGANPGVRVRVVFQRDDARPRLGMPIIAPHQLVHQTQHDPRALTVALQPATIALRKAVGPIPPALGSRSRRCIVRLDRLERRMQPELVCVSHGTRRLAHDRLVARILPGDHQHQRLHMVDRAHLLRRCEVEHRLGHRWHCLCRCG